MSGQHDDKRRKLTHARPREHVHGALHTNDHSTTPHSFADLIDSLTPPSKSERAHPPPPASSPPASPHVQVAASSPRPGPVSKSSTSFNFASASSSIVPRGTLFRTPAGVQHSASKPIDLTFDDPPIELISADEDDLPDPLAPTRFTGGHKGSSSPIRVEESPKPDTSFRKLASSYAYNPASDMANAYGNGDARKHTARQSGPARAMPVGSIDKLSYISNPEEKIKVQRMLETFPDVKATVLSAALERKKGNLTDALEYVAQQQDALLLIQPESTRSDVRRIHRLRPAFDVEVLYELLKTCNWNVDLALTKACDLNGLDDPKVQLRKLYAAPKAKQQVNAPQRSIAAKWATQSHPKSSTAQSPVKAHPQVAEPVTKPRRRLVQGSRPRPVSPEPESSPIDPRTASRKRQVTTIESEDEAEASAASSDDIVIDDHATATGPSPSRLLHFLNTCSPAELADLANEKQDNVDLVIAQRPFKSLAAVRSVGEDTSGKSRKRPVGDRLVDVCEEMWAGYEAVDQLVQKCEDLSQPIRTSMKAWGVDLQSTTSDGELALTKIEGFHDSGIGTPASTSAAETSTYLSQPGIMSPTLVMKDYQIFGLNWLNLLWRKDLSCILADDMGLGKTCQVIAFLSHLKETGVRGTHLVMVPGSTLENWLREFQRFSPSLGVRPYYGSQRDREEQREEFEAEKDEIDVVVTTYETAVSQADNKFLRKYVKPVACIFDEGHALKNSATKRHRELMRIPARFRLLLTGTPLQNNLQELVSLLNFILPEVFEEHQDDLKSIFKYKATTKETDHTALLSAQRIRRARSMMTPFILRRKKQQVLKDIPAKHRRVEYCDMTDRQRSLCDDYVNAIKRERSAQVVSKTKPTSVHMTSLRQAALHPLLLRRLYTDERLRELQKILIEHPDSEYIGNREDLVWKFLTSDLKGGDYALHKFCSERKDYIPGKFVLREEEWMQSGKVHKLKALMEGFIANGDRVLLFSQFTSMMDILEAVFETLSMKFMRLDGSTPMASRQDMIDQFTTDPTIPVFMLSTKAGGAGINLACANKVVIFDSSFNPQDDIQAENRAHRVGQTREVEVVRLITKDTIEVMIHALGESKLALDERVAGDPGASLGDGVDGADAKKLEKESEKKIEDMFLNSLDKIESKSDS